MISIILPTYNEAGNIKLLIQGIKKSLKGYSLEIIVVDDNSPDKTWKIVNYLAEKNPEVKLIRRIHTRGLTSAFNYGISKSSGSIVGWMDSDMSMPPEYLRTMVKNIPNYDVVIGSRYLKNGGDERENKLAVILSLILNKTARIFLGKSLTDYTSGFVLAKRHLFANFKLTGDYGEYCIDMIVNFKRKGYKIIEIPYVCKPRNKGESKTASNLFGFIIRGRKYILTIVKLWLKK
jgi:dolichol-phosphate mannosyltransferase